MTVESRIKELRTHKSLNQKDFGESIGLSLMNVSDIERGKVKASIDVIKSISKSFRISLDWLLSGEGEMFRPSEEEKESQSKPSLGYLEEVLATKGELKETKEKLEDLKKVAQASQKELAKLKNYVYRHHPKEEDELHEPEVMYTLEHVGLAGAAGALRELDTVRETVEVPEHLLPKNKEGLFAGRIEGESMADIIPDGANVLLRVCKEPVSGRVYVFTLRGHTTVKKFHIDHTGPHFEYMDGSGRSIYPEAGEQWYCNAEFLSVLG